MNPIFVKIFEAFVGKKKIIGWISAVLLAIGAASVSMQTEEFKKAVCDAPVIEQKALEELK